MELCRDGKGEIPVKSRCHSGNPDRDCTENICFCSAKSTKSEINYSQNVTVSEFPEVLKVWHGLGFMCIPEHTEVAEWRRKLTDWLNDSCVGFEGPNSLHSDCFSFHSEIYSKCFCCFRNLKVYNNFDNSENHGC